MSDRVRVVLVGAGGYGYEYARALLDECPARGGELVGVVDPHVGRADLVAELRALGVPTFGSDREFFETGAAVELAVIASPIHLHVPHSLMALAHGCHVLCDKPLGATVQEADELISARDAAHRLVWIGYQWSFATGIQRLKNDILAGRFGAPRRGRTLCFWPRDRTYYRRNDWAGRTRDTATGRWVLDSPFNNAQAHFIHNLLYLVGHAADRSAAPATVQAEAGRRFPIETFDSVACRVQTADGVELLFVGSHATTAAAGPMFEIELERATVRYDATPGVDEGQVVAEMANGERVTYRAPDADHQFQKLFEAIRSVRETRPVTCGPEAARAQTLCANGVHESVESVAEVSASDADGLRRCYDEWRLPSELGLGWAVPGRRVDVRGYVHYPSSVVERTG